MSLTAFLLVAFVLVVVLLLVGVYAVVRLSRHETDPIDQTDDERP